MPIRDEAGGTAVILGAAGAVPVTGTWSASVAPFQGRCLFGDVRERLAELPAASVHCAVTSPPFWGLRDYGTGKWTGGDPVCVHDAGGRRQVPQTKSPAAAGSIVAGGNRGAGGSCVLCGAERADRQLGLEPLHDCLGWATGAACGDCYVCHTVAWAAAVRRVLREDGTLWLELGDSYNGSGGAGGDYGVGGIRAGQPRYKGRNLRQKRDAGRTIQGLKAKDLCGIPWRVALALQADGWWLRSDIVWARNNPMPESVTDRPAKAHSYVFMLTRSQRYFYDAEALRESGHAARSVFTINTVPFAGAHFAVFPPELPRRCILVGTSERGVCPECGAPWTRMVERTPMEVRPGPGRLAKQAANGDLTRTATEGTMTRPPRSVTVGWEPSCGHGDEPVPALVLDPFLGSATTGMVARDLGRSWTGCDLNPAYAGVQAERLGGPGLVERTQAERAGQATMPW